MSIDEAVAMMTRELTEKGVVAEEIDADIFAAYLRHGSQDMVIEIRVRSIQEEDPA